MNPLLRCLLVGVSALLLSSVALAQPAHAPAHGARDNAVQAERHRGDESGHRDRGAHRAYRGGERAGDGYVDLPRINERELRRLLRRDDAPRGQPLPPGIQRHVERGKPLPPGIAQRFDGSFAHALPAYSGYEWERVGADVVLIEAATRIVVEVLEDALR